MSDLINREKLKEGEWIEDEDIDISDDGRFAIRCSKCGKYNGYSKTNFCPNCGADMRTESEVKPNEQ